MKLKLLGLVLALQAAWVIGTVFVHERGLASGVTILLETRPVDPRDLLRGDYVILSYPISEIPESQFEPTVTNLAPGQEVYVALEKMGEFHGVKRASTKPIAATEDEVVLRGKISPRIRMRGRPFTAAGIDYGLERYYVGEGLGNPRGKLTVAVAVPASGRAQIKEVFLDGQPYATAIRAQVNNPSTPADRARIEAERAEARARAEAEARARAAAEKAATEAAKAKAEAEKRK